MRRAVDKFIRDNKKSTFSIQLTSMVDMFTILIVFLLKSQSSSAVQVTPQKGLELPHSASQQEAQSEAVKLVVTEEGVFVQDEMVVVIKDGRIEKAAFDKSDPDFIRPLYEALDKEAEKVQKIAEKNSELKFDGKVIMQASKTLPYDLLKKVMYTSSVAGYADFKMATFAIE